MAHRRKWFLVLAVVAIVLSLGSAPANAQPVPFNCVANSITASSIRAEGFSELLPDLVLVCSGGTPTPAKTSVPAFNLTITLNTTITSRFVGPSGPSEATLLIDEPVPSTATVSSPPPQVLCAPAQGATSCAVFGDGLGTPYETVSGTPTVYQGHVVAGNQNQISFPGVPIDAPGNNIARVIRITNLRVNASQLLVSTPAPAQVVMSISMIAINGPTQIDAAQTVAFPQPGLIVSVTSGTGVRCASQNTALIAGGNPSPGDGPNFNVTLREGFASSFKRRNNSLTATTAPQNIPGFAYNTETGFYNPDLFKATPDVGLADVGTRFRITFDNIVAGARFFVPTTISLTNASATGVITGRLVLVQSDLSGNSPRFLTVAATGTSGGVPVAPISAGGAPGVGFAIYEVVNSDANELETVTVPVSVAFVVAAGQNLPGSGQTTTVNVSFAAWGSATGDPNVPIPRFVESSTALKVFAINQCCKLLFPHVSNQSGLNTTLSIANTSVGSGPPFNTSTQPGGKVTLYYFGGTQPGNGAAPPPQTTLGRGTQAGIVPAGCELVFTLSSGGAVTNCGALTATPPSATTIAAAPGFGGFIIAVAGFPSCQGFASIADTGNLHGATGYLAIPLHINDMVGLNFDLVGLNRTGIVGENEGH